MTTRTMLDFPDPLPDEQRVSTGIEELDRLLLRWLDRRDGDRFAQRADDRCVLVDRGTELRASTASSYEDSVRKVLQVALDRDSFESKTGRLPGADE